MDSIFCGIEKLSLVDFDGKIVCTLFTEVCNFHCPFCHNKDLVYANNTHPLPFDEILTFLTNVPLTPFGLFLTISLISIL